GPAVDAGVSTSFYVTFAILAVAATVMIVRYYLRMNAERLQVVKLLSSSVMPMALLIVLVLGAILLGITTATESAAIGAAGALLLALQARTL
ncbi:TRAP transporter large permease subunit, partial [Enterococcus faecium]|uniref:TRAP transporter large permease subunit n=1 Tax=Enterococcus faecium TaxID=1352 RepID=UPI003F4211A4